MYFKDHVYIFMNECVASKESSKVRYTKTPTMKQKKVTLRN